MLGSGPSSSRTKRVGRRAAGTAVAAALVASLVLLGSGLLPHADPAEPRTPARTRALTPVLPPLADPQFLPLVLPSPLPTEYGHFGAAVAASGASVTVAAPGEEEEAGAVELENTSTGASAALADPGETPDGEFGTAVAMTATHVVVGAPGENNSSGMVYVYHYQATVADGLPVLTTELVVALASPNATSYPGLTEFGSSVAISGDLVVIGAPYESYLGSPAAGHAYVLNLANGSVKMLSSPEPEIDGFFGSAVAISGTTVVVGSPGGGNPSIEAGIAYVFAATTGDLETTLVSSEPADEGEFGASVAVNGSLAVVGAPFEAGGSELFGAGDAYVFNLSNGSNVTLTSPEPQESGEFGASVALDASTILVGAPGEGFGESPSSGNAYVFGAPDPGLVLGYLAPPDWPNYGRFGTAVAENGAGTIVVGAPYENASNVEDAGLAYVFPQVPLLVESPNPYAGSSYGGEFGQSVAIDGPVVLGAPEETASAVAQAGHAYLLRSHGGPFVTLASPDPTAEGHFGSSVAVTGGRAVVGAPGEGAPELASGRAYLFDVPTGTLASTLVSPTSQAGGAFGTSVAASGPFVVVGAPGETVSGVADAGRAYVYYAANATLAAILVSPDGVASGFFGASVAVTDGTVLVGAPGEASGAGTAYLFNASHGTLVAALGNPQSGGTGFGESVAASGSVAVVGAPGDEEDGLTDAGSAYVYSAVTGVLQHALVSLEPATDGEFGASVATNGGTVVVGAPGETTPFGPAGGNVYLFNAGSGVVTDRYNSLFSQNGGNFGLAVSVGPAGNVVVGAPEESPAGGASSGQAYLFFL